MPEATHIEGFDLSDMEYDEISLVTRGGNQEADVLIFKSAGGKDCEEGHSQLGDGEKCEFCDYTGKKKVKKAEPFVVKPVPVPARIEKGDKPGHPFRGNQHVGGSGGGTANSGRAMRGGKKRERGLEHLTDAEYKQHKADEAASAAPPRSERSVGTGRQKYPKGDARNTPRSASDQARFGKPKKKATRGETFGTWQSESSNGMKMSRNGDMTIRQSDSGSFVVSDHGQRIEHQIPRGATMAQARRHVEDSILAPRLKTATAKPKPKSKGKKKMTPKERKAFLDRQRRMKAKMTPSEREAYEQGLTGSSTYRSL